MGVPVSNCSALGSYRSLRLVTHNIAPKLRQNRFNYNRTPGLKRLVGALLWTQHSESLKRLPHHPCREPSQGTCYYFGAGCKSKELKDRDVKVIIFLVGRIPQRFDK